MAFKNYPNQATAFKRLRDTLAIISELHDRGQQVLDDGVLGYELARRRAYTFRKFDYVNGTPESLEARITQEREKPSGRQGARTNARELRRTLIDLGWLRDDGSLSPSGRSVLESQEQSDEERGLLKQGLLDLELSDDDDDTSYSHPVRILLELLRHAPTTSRAGLELIFEATDDSDRELDRIKSLYDEIRLLPSNERAERIGIPESKRANSVKVFPTLAKYAGLVTEDASGVWRPSPAGLAAIGVPTDDEAEAMPPATVEVSAIGANVTAPAMAGAARRRRKLTRGAQKAASELGNHSVNRTVPRGLSPDQQAEAQRRLQERTEAHQALVRDFASRLSTGQFYEDTSSYDFVWSESESGPAHLFEMKTIDSDADAQVIRAVGQLMYYAHFNVVARFAEYPASQTLVVDGPLHDDLCDFLDSLNIGALQVTLGSNVIPLNHAGHLAVARLPLMQVAGE